MSNARGSDFEPAFGSRSSDGPLAPRLRDRHDDPDAGGSISELVESVGSRKTVGERSAPGEPSSTRASSPVIPPEVLDARADAGTGRDHAGPTRAGTPWSKFRRRAVAAGGVAVVLGMAYFLVTLAQVWSTGRTDDDGPVDAIVVMGAAQYDGRPSPQLAARLDHVVTIWPNAVAPLVVVTGGNIPGDRFTEAESSAQYLIERGVPGDAILLEDSGSNSQESLTSVAALLTARGLDEVLIVTDPYHALRSRLIAEELGLDTQVSSTDTSVVTGFDSLTRHLQEAGGVSIGRIIGFQRLSELVD